MPQEVENTKSHSIKCKSKVIFTCNLFAYDDFFKIYTALNVVKKTTYIVGQHGNNMFTRIFTNNVVELKVCDSYLSWGFKNKKKIKKLYNFKLASKFFKARTKDKKMFHYED